MKFLKQIILVLFINTLLSAISQQTADLIKPLANQTLQMQYYFWMSAKNNYFLTSIKDKDTFHIWRFTSDKKWQPVHNAGKYDGYPLAKSIFSSLDYKNRQIVIGEANEIKSEFKAELQTTSFDVLYYFWITNPFSYLMKPRENGEFSIWNLTSDKKWVPLHNASAYDGYPSAGESIFHLSFDYDKAILKTGDLDPIANMCIQNNFCF